MISASRVACLLLVSLAAAAIVATIAQREFQKEVTVMVHQLQAAEFHAIHEEARAVKARDALREALNREAQCEDVITQCCK